MASELIEADLYAGKYRLIHNPFARGSQPRYVVETDGTKTKPVGVTTILGQTLSKDLMQWAVDCGISYLRELVEEGITHDHLDAAGQEYIRKRDFGAGTGTEAHALVEKFLKGETPTLAVTTTEAKNAYRAFTKWFNLATPTVVNVEQVIYSQQYGYAGTYDCLLNVDGVNYLGDLKTTNSSRKAPKGVYAEHFLQLGAYAQAHEEQRAYELAETGTSRLVAIDDLMVISAKKNGVLDIVRASDLGLSVEECREHFIKVVQLYDLLKSTTNQLGGR